MMSGILIAGDTKGQSIREVRISLTLEEASPAEALAAIEKATKFKFLYKKVIFTGNEPQISLKARNKTVADILQKIARQTGLSFHQVNNIIAVHPAVIPDSGPPGQPIAPQPPNQIITGQVTDEQGRPLPGASVLVKGFALGAVTDQDGRYTLEAPDDATTLVFSFIGYITEEVEIAGRSVIDFSMLPDIQSLQGVEVVSTGYYEVEQRLNPGNIAKIDARVIEQQPISNPLQALQGRLTGVSIRQRSGVPGSPFDIQIRGLNSLRDDGNDPLYLINGVPFPSQAVTSTQALTGGAINPLNFINPNDIESIEILKDADATAIYGTRGANGVVRITTKKGKADKLRVTYNGSIGVGTLENKFDVLNKDQYLMMRNEALANDGREPRDSDFDVNGTWSTDRETDWQEELLGGSSNFSNHQLTFSGGALNTTFLFGMNYLKQTTLFSNDFADRKISGNLNLHHTSNNDRFNLDFTANLLVNNNELFSSRFAPEAVTLAPNAPPLRNEDGSLNWENGTFNNPLAGFLKESNTRSTNLVTNLQLSYELLEGLKVKSSFGYTELQGDEITIDPIASQNPFKDLELEGSSEFGNSSTTTWLVEPQLEYTRLFDQHQIAVLGGVTFQETITNTQRVTATGYDSDALLKNPLAAENTEVTQSDNSEYRFNSAYARINYIYDEKYIINLTGRRDGSSRFGPGRQFANFGAIGAAWIFSEEDFIANKFGFLSYGKLRGSYGVTGSDQIGNYQFLELWNPTNLGYDGVQGLFPANLFNENFAWEKTTKAEVGLEFGVLEDRIRVSTSYFQNSSSNQLISEPLPGITGFNSVQANFPAEVENTGWEIELNTLNLSKGDFRWSSSFNISILRNELVSFDNIESTTFANQFEVGEPLSVLFLLNYTGVDPETGLATFQDLDSENNLGVADRLPLENRQQDYFGGFQNSLSYKGLTIDFLFRFVKQLGSSYQNGFAIPGEFSNQPIQVLDRWQNPGDVTDIPKFTQTGLARAANLNIRGSNQNFEDASFIRLQNLILAYDFPVRWIRKYRAENLRIYLQGQNLLTLTRYRGWDPETQGQSLPPLRIMTVGLTVTL